MKRSTATAVASAAIAGLSLSLSAPASAGPRCTDAPQSAWIGQSDMLRKLADSGYSMDAFQVTRGQCYEIHGRDKAGDKVEIYFDPVDGRIVKRKRG